MHHKTVQEEVKKGFGVRIPFLLSLILGAGLLSSCSMPQASSKISKKTDPKKSTLRPTPTATGNSSEHTSTIKIGLVVPETGVAAPWGSENLKGAKLAIQEINKKGGIQGKKIELLIGDSASKPDQARSAAEKLIANGAIAIIGEILSGATAQIALTCFDKGIPQITCSSTRKDLTLIGDNIFRVCYTGDVQGPVMAKFALEQLNIRRAALFTDKQQPYSNDLSNGFREYFEKHGGQIVCEEFYETGQAQFGPQLTNVRSKYPEALLVSGYYSEAGPIIRQAKAMGLKNTYMLGGDGWDNEELLNSGGLAIQKNAFYCTHYSFDEQREEIQDYIKYWEKTYHSKPKTILAALGYDGTKLLLSAIQRAEKVNSRAVTKAINETENFMGITGKITMKGANGDPKKRTVILTMTPKGPKFLTAYEYNEIFDKDHQKQVAKKI